AIMAWVLFLLVAPLVNVAATSLLSFLTSSSSELSSGISPSILILMSLMIMLTFFVPWSFGALVIVGLPSAYLLGHRLRTVSTVWVHVVAFVALGAVVGAATTLVTVLVIDVASMGEWAVPVAFVSNTVLTALAVVAGWWFTSQRAFADDAAVRGAEDGSAAA
ncbi:MAG TPA: hypothetical protein PK890_12155, partial [Terrimesophilobacter sp.]|nr:hypothetical protein [Terrimesophilobacter sp.]